MQLERGEPGTDNKLWSVRPELELGGRQLIKSQPRNLPYLVLLEVSKVDTLFTISEKNEPTKKQLKTGEVVGEGVNIVSKIVSLFAKNFRNRLLSTSLNLTMEHLSLQAGVGKVSGHFLSLDILG